MINFFYHGSQIHISRLLSKFLAVGILSTVGLVSGLIPGFSAGSPGLVFTQAAQAQVNDQEITSYARTVLALEKGRQQAYEKIKSTIGSNEVPNIVCSQAGSINSLPRNVRDIAVNYCNQSKQIVESNGLTISRFNAITVSLQNNSALQQQVKEAMLRLQQN